MLFDGVCVSLFCCYLSTTSDKSRQQSGANCLLMSLEYGKVRRQGERVWQTVLWEQQVSCDKYTVCFQEDRLVVLSSLQLKAGVSWSATMGLMILMFSLFRTLDKATYPIPFGTVGQSNQTINFLMLAPCVLQMVMQYPGLRE